MSERQKDVFLEPGRVTFRRGVPGDDLMLGDIDGSFATDTIFEVRPSANGFTLNEKSVSSPIVKKFPLCEDTDVEDEEESARFIAVDADGTPAGSLT